MGLRYTHNEDALYNNNEAIQSPHFSKIGKHFFGHYFAAIFDGVGGAEKGEVASLCAAEACKRYKLSTIKDRKSFFEFVDYLNNSICEKQKEIGNNDALCTFCGVQIINKTIHFANVGDSPIYLIRNHSIKKMCVEDTYKNKLINEGRYSLEEIEQMNTAHIITNCLGDNYFEKYKTHYFSEPLHHKDVIALMSDGVSDLISEQELLSLIDTNNKKESITKIEELVRARGARDNYSIIILEV